MSDPALSIAYRVVIDGVIPLGWWTKIDGLGMEFQVTEYREGGVNGYVHRLVGPAKTTNVRLSRPVNASSPVIMAWLQSNLLAVVPQTMAITAMTAEGKEITTWSLLGVVPVKWTGPSLDIMSNQIATETLELSYREISAVAGLVSGLAGA